ncbi:MAG: hypothetical protein AAF549_01980 [Pseudomonadota bacterium]
MAIFSGKVGLSIGRASGNGATSQLLQIVKIPNQIVTQTQSANQNIRISGEITNVNPQNNQVTVQTNQGEVTVRAQNTNQAQNLQTGQRVIIEVPPTQNPTQARVSFENITPQARDNSRPQASTPPPQTTQTPQSNPVQNNRVSPTDIDLPVQNISQSLPKAVSRLTNAVTEEIANQLGRLFQQAPQNLTNNQTVRLIAVTQAQANNIIQQTINQLPPPIQSNLQVSNNNLIQSITSQASNFNIGANLTPATITQNVFTPPIQTSPALSQAINNIVQIIPTTNIVENPALQIPSNSQILSDGQVLRPQNIAQVTEILNRVQIAQPIQGQPATTGQINAQSAAANTAQPIIFDPAIPQSPQNNFAPKFQAQIISIDLPRVIITSPAQISTNIASNPIIINVQNNPISPSIANPLNNNPVAQFAQIVGITPRSFPLISIPVQGTITPQNFIVQTPTSNLQIGSQLQILPRAGAIVPNTLTLQSVQLIQWPAFEEINMALRQMNPQAADSLLRSLPSVSNPAKLAASGALFAAALRAGDLTAFLGERKVDLLRQIGRDNLLSRLGQGEGAQRVDATSAGDWRAVPLPLFWENEIHKIMLYTRREDFDQSTQDNEDGNSHTRFLFDLSLSKIGDVQIDGFLKEQRLDLIVRTHNSFSSPMQQTMRQLYMNALDETSLSGELNFQSQMNNWVHVNKENENYGRSI